LIEAPIKHRGSVAELSVCTYLLRKGYEVFRNVSPSGLCDIVAWNPSTGEKLLYDVKSSTRMYLRKDGTKNPGARKNLSTEQTALGVRLIEYDQETGDVTEH